MLPLVSQPERRKSGLETNLARYGGWDIGGRKQSMEVRGKDFLGVVARRGAELGSLEMDVLSWYTARWYEQQRDPEGMVRHTLYELGQDLYGRKPSGKEVRLLRGAIENLAAALITLGGYNAHTGEARPKLASMVHLIESAVWAEDLDVETPTREDGPRTGGLRGNSYEVRLAPWLVRQLENQYVTYLDWRTQRRLDGLAKRLWVYLEAEQYKAVGNGRESSYIILGEKAYTALSVNNARERDRRLALKRAGEKIMSVDERYESVIVERNPVGRNQWRVLATRCRDAERRSVRAAISQSLAEAGTDARAGHERRSARVTTS